MKIFHEKNPNLLNKKLSKHKAHSFNVSIRHNDGYYSEHVSGIYHVYTTNYTDEDGRTRTSNHKSYQLSIFQYNSFISILPYSHRLKIIDLRRNHAANIPKSSLLIMLQMIISQKKLFLECLCLGHDISNNILQELTAIIQNKPTLKYLEFGGRVCQADKLSFYNATTLNLFKSTLYKSQLLYLGLTCFSRQITHHLIKDFDFENTTLLDLNYSPSYAEYSEFKVLDQKIKKVLQRNRDLADVRTIINALRDKSRLHDNQLDLSGKVIKATDFLQLVAVIIENKNLIVTELDLSDALLDVTEDADIIYAEGLVKLLNEKHSIRKLDISNSIFGKNILILTLAEAIAQNCFLLKLTMKDTNFNPEVLAQFVDMIDANRGLIDIKLSTMLKKKKFAPDIFDKVDDIAKRNRKLMSKLHDAIKGGDVKAIQSALKIGANPFACVEPRRKLKLFKKHQDLIFELEDEADPAEKQIKPKAQVAFDIIITSELLRAQQQVRQSMRSANELITQYLQQHGDDGNAMMQYHLAQRYLNGVGTARDEKMALHWLTSAAAQDYGPAQYLVGMMYLRGYGCTVNHDEAIQWLIKASLNNQAEAAYQLGLIYFAQDEIEDANKNMNSANELGLPLARLTLGLQQGSARKQVQQETISKFELGIFTDWETFTIEGNAEEKEKALNKIRHGANQENITAAQFRLSQLYRQGKTLAVDYAEAFRLCQLAAEQKHIQANYQLAKLYLDGQGCDQDFNMAIKHFEQAGQLGCADAYYDLAMLYSPKDNFNVYTNTLLAMKYLILAAELNHAQANYKLAKLHDEKGLQFFSSEWAARKYNERALKFGYSKARIPLFKLDKQLEGLLRAAPLPPPPPPRDVNSSDDEGASIKPI